MAKTSKQSRGRMIEDEATEAEKAEPAGCAGMVRSLGLQ